MEDPDPAFYPSQLPTVYPGNIRHLLILVFSPKQRPASTTHINAKIGTYIAALQSKHFIPDKKYSFGEANYFSVEGNT
jgi:hypothetical protein